MEFNQGERYFGILNEDGNTRDFPAGKKKKLSSFYHNKQADEKKSQDVIISMSPAKSSSLFTLDGKLIYTEFTR